MKRAILLALVAGIALGAGATYWLLDRAPALDAADAEPEPIYWVAPMDPNYRRDKPGKSPMGMDLVPVYAEPRSAQQDSKGTVRISPEVINNLGVRTARAESRQLENSVRTVGYVQYDEDRLIHIHPRVEGWIEKLHIKAAGDPNRIGDLNAVRRMFNEARWVRWNKVRAVAATAAFGLLAWSLVLYGGT